MPKKTYVRTLMESEDVKRSERLLKSARHYFSHIFFNTLKQNQLKCTAVFLSYFLIIHQENQLKKFCFSNI